MKISILIPIYNFDVEILIGELFAQCVSTADLQDFEIRLYDDASSLKTNNSHLTSAKIIYKELPENIGRSKIRNLLAEEALYETILFLDCDSAIEKKDFVTTYVQHYHDKSVVYGGRTYSESEPKNEACFLRWKYGREREIIPADVRIQDPYSSFMTNNFLICKEVFLALKLDESLVGYGHEDTLFGIELKKKGIPIIHIDNPAVHIGLEPYAEFLEKTKEGIVNLHSLYLKQKIGKKEAKLLDYYWKMNRFPLKQLFQFYYRKKEEKINRNLGSKQARMRNFDFYKLNEILKL